MKRLAVAAAVLLAAGAACTSSSTYVSHVSPEASPSTSPSESPTPSPSASPTASAPLAITSVPVHDGEITIAFAPISMSASGGIGPYSWAIGGGALPAGLLLSAQGVISGTVTKAGTFKFTVAVADSGGHQATRATQINVVKQLTAKGTCSAKCVIGAGCTKCGVFGTTTGGEPPLAVSPTGGAVPPGMNLSGLSVVGGFPAGTWTLTVQVTDKFGAKVNVQAFWSIYSPPVLKKGGDCLDTVNNPPSCSVRWTYSGGSSTPKVVILGYAKNCNAAGVCATPNAAPASWNVTAGSGVVTITASMPACTTGTTSYIGTIQLALADGSKCPTTSLSNEVDLAVDLEHSC